jgi:hypothetical protein
MVEEMMMEKIKDLKFQIELTDISRLNATVGIKMSLINKTTKIAMMSFGRTFTLRPGDKITIDQFEISPELTIGDEIAED